MRKFLLVILSALMLACLCAFVACNGNKDTYHTLVFRQANGVRYVCDIRSGWEVKDGTVVKFKLAFDDDVEGKENAVVSIGSLSAASSTDNEGREILTPNSNGEYSFKIKQNTEVRVDGIIAKGEYNTLVFSPTPGVMYTILNDGLANGMSVRKGTIVRFTITVAEGYEGNPEVYANGELLEKDGNGVYSFTMTEPTTVRVEGIIRLVNLNFNAGSSHVRYIDEDGKYITTDVNEIKRAGDVIRFKVEISVYYVQEGYEVLGAGGQILKPGSDGFYQFTIENNTNIKVSKLELEPSFTARDGGGSGTAYDPYRISKPVDLYQMAMLINDDYWTDGRYFNGYYRLENDIDLKGEQLYIIGDSSTYIAFFAGKFDGQGHTISNYYITDEWINQETFDTEYITNVGLFGYVTPTTTSFPEIYNLHLDNFKISANPSRYPESDEVSYETYVGGLIGMSFGASVTGCTATNGTIEVTGGNYQSFVGGLIGQQMSAYAADGSFMYYSAITSCYADVDVNIDGNGFVYATGGITGLLAVGEEHVSAYILNSYSTGSVNGGLNAGGIVGYASAGTSVINCYSAGDVTAYSPYVFNEGYGTDEFYRANAGGIVGRLGFNSLVYNSFSMGDIYASNMAGSSYQNLVIMDDIAAYREHGEDLRDATTYEPIVFGSKAVKSVSENFENFIYNEMHWNAEDWKFENGMPVINFDEAELEFRVSFNVKTGFGTAPADIKLSEYRSMANWYLQQKGIPEFVEGNSGMRSYSYFFDAELKHKVPYSFIPTTNVTLYVGHADYSQVWGTYFLGDSLDSKARLELKEDGTFEYRNGGLNITSVYTWDGEQLVLLTTYLGELSTSEKLSGQDYRDYYLSSLYNFSATVDTNTHALTIVGGYVQEIEIQEKDGETAIVSTGNIFYLFEDGNSLTGVKVIEGFNYGEYYYDNNVYAFYANGTGTVKGTNETTFTYVYNATANTLTITYANGNTPVTAQIVDGYVSQVGEWYVEPFDGFTGTWEREFTMNDSYSFDGKGMNHGEGSWTYTDNVGGQNRGKYNVTDGVLTASGNHEFTAKINDDGFLEITKGDKKYIYYADGSFAGDWFYNQSVKDGSRTVTVSINITLGGIARDGYGVAKAEFGTGEVYDLNYHATVGETKKIYIYNGVVKFAELTFDEEKNLLSGEVDGRRGRIVAYDNFKGTWISDNATLETVTFNGFGYYDLPGNESTRDVAVSGTVRLGSKSAGKYTISRDSLTGTYTYNGVTYTLNYNESTGFIDVTAPDTEKFTLQPRDIWYTNQLIDDDGFVYSFDGRGNLASGGKMTADNGNMSDLRYYTYELRGDQIIVTSDEPQSYSGGTISVVDNVFKFDRGNGDVVSLTRHTPFTGKWAIGGERGAIEIGKIYADGSATGKYTSSKYEDGELKESTKDITLTYDIAGGFMHFELDEVTYYINAITSSTATELSIGPDNSITSSVNSICINYTLKDKFADRIVKVYNPKTETDTGEVLIFDGLSASVFLSGTVVFYNEEGVAMGGYSYTIDKFGFARLLSGNNPFYMVPWTVGQELAYSVLYYVHAGDDYYAIVSPDWLDGVTVTDSVNTNVSFEFNGVGGVTMRTKGSDNVQSFTYIILLRDNLSKKHVIALSDDNGATYKWSLTLDQNSSDKTEWTATMKEADELFGLYVKDAASEEAYFLFDGVDRVIRLSTEEQSVNYTYEIINVTADKVELTFTTSAGKVYTAILDRSSENEEEWTVTLGTDLVPGWGS